MEKGELPFSVLVKRIINELRESTTTLYARFKAIEAAISSIRYQKETEKEQQYSQWQRPIVLRAELQIPEDVKRDQGSRDNRQYGMQRWLTIGTWLTFIAAAVYAGFNYDMLRQMERTMRIDNRAWLKVGTQDVPLVIGEPIFKTISIVNIGKTAALNLTGALVVNLLPINEEPELSYPKHGHPNIQFQVRALMPDTPQTLHRVPGMPKRTAPNNTVAPIIFTKDMEGGIGDGSLYVVVHGQITYDDVFGTHHWLKFCEVSTRAIPGIKTKRGADTCADYNDVDRNF